MDTRSLKGIVAAVVTPFRPDERIDCNSWQAIIDTLIGAGVDGLLALGSTGEFFALDQEERVVAMRFCQQAVARRVPLFCNVGSVTTRDTIRLAQQAEDQGIDVAVVVTPYYLKPSPDELAEHYIEVCRAVHMPVMGYNFPLHGGVELMPETVARIAAKCDNFVGLKDSSGKLDQAAAYLDCAPGRRLAVFFGSDHLIVPALDRGCAGAVTGFANVAPRLFVEMYRAWQGGKREEAARLQAIAGELSGTLMLHTFPSIIKDAMQIAGLPAGHCRRPVSPAPAAVLKQLARVVTRLEQGNYLPGAAKITPA